MMGIFIFGRDEERAGSIVLVFQTLFKFDSSGKDKIIFYLSHRKKTRRAFNNTVVFSSIQYTGIQNGEFLLKGHVLRVQNIYNSVTSVSGDKMTVFFVLGRGHRYVYTKNCACVCVLYVRVFFFKPFSARLCFILRHENFRGEAFRPERHPLRDTFITIITTYVDTLVLFFYTFIYNWYYLSSNIPIRSIIFRINTAFQSYRTNRRHLNRLDTQRYGRYGQH